MGGGSKGEGEEKVLVIFDLMCFVMVCVEEEFKSLLTNMFVGDFM